MSLAELIGNTRVKATLASYLRNERVPSSLIFTGSDPYHQLLFALNFAKSLDCLEKNERRLRPLPPLPGHRPRTCSPTSRSWRRKASSTAKARWTT